AAHPEANIIFGAVIDDALGDEVRVTVIAAGFDGGGPTKLRDDRALASAERSGDSRGGQHPQPPAPSRPASSSGLPAPSRDGGSGSNGESGSTSSTPAPTPAPVGATGGSQTPPRAVTFDDGDDLDVPDFLK
ncbi:MAG: cell division protein FtsZ, partial [Actinomycetota bacterium]|nr:cell division protein FtsZ [Actinomycetota bacterium]